MAGSTRVDMINLLTPLNNGAFIRRQEPLFADIHAFLLTVPSPKYPFPVNRELAGRGRELFHQHCSRCHGAWATAPYFHNGSVLTVYQVLNSRARPKIFTRSFHTGKEDYDPVKLGWKVTVLDRPPDPRLPGRERRKVYDTTRRGQSNAGHPFGDKLTEGERMAVIEYLKTL